MLTVHFAVSHFAISHYLTLILTPNPTPRKWEMAKWETAKWEDIGNMIVLFGVNIVLTVWLIRRSYCSPSPVNTRMVDLCRQVNCLGILSDTQVFYPPRDNKVSIFQTE